MKEKESERPDECLDWKKEVVCKKDEHVSNINLPPCGRTWEIEEKDFILFYCNKFNWRYVGIKCPYCGKTIEVSRIDKMPVPIQHRLKNNEMIYDSCSYSD